MAWIFHNLNIKHPHYAAMCKDAPRSAAHYWLEQRQQAPIFFDDFPLDRIRDNDFMGSGWAKSHQTQMCAFVDLENQLQCAHRTILITIDSGWVWIYEPYGRCQMADEADMLQAEGETEHPKVFNIQVLKKVHIKDAPLVLSSMKSNQFLVRGTFSQVYPREGGTYLGNAAAVQALIGQWDPSFPATIDPLDCLSSLEFETLIAKLFEEMGCFVPAYKGGFLRDVDLIVHSGNTPINLAGFCLEAGCSQAIQLKMSIRAEDLSAAANGTVQALMGLNHTQSIAALRTQHPACFGRDWVWSAIQQCSGTKAWLARNLSWLASSKQYPKLQP